METITVRRWIPAAPSAVWPRVFDLDHAVLDDPDLDVLSGRLEGEPLAVGTTTIVTHRRGVRQSRTELTVVDVDAPRHLVVSAAGPNDERWWITLELAELPGDHDTGSDLTLRARREGDHGPLGRRRAHRVGEDLSALLEGIARAAERVAVPA